MDSHLIAFRVQFYDFTLEKWLVWQEGLDRKEAEYWKRVAERTYPLYDFRIVWHRLYTVTVGASHG